MKCVYQQVGVDPWYTVSNHDRMLGLISRALNKLETDVDDIVDPILDMIFQTALDRDRKEP